MSRTYRKSPQTEYTPNLEAYETRYRYYGFWFGIGLNFYDGPCVETAHKWFKHFRDGRQKESGRNQGYKDTTNRAIRASTRELNNRIMKDIEVYDEVIYDDKYTHKYLVWSFW